MPKTHKVLALKKCWCPPKFQQFSPNFSSQYLCSQVFYQKMVKAKSNPITFAILRCHMFWSLDPPSGPFLFALLFVFSFGCMRDPFLIPYLLNLSWTLPWLGKGQVSSRTPMLDYLFGVSPCGRLLLAVGDRSTGFWAVWASFLAVPRFGPSSMLVAFLSSLLLAGWVSVAFFSCPGPLCWTGPPGSPSVPHGCLPRVRTPSQVILHLCTLCCVWQTFWQLPVLLAMARVILEPISHRHNDNDFVDRLGPHLARRLHPWSLPRVCIANAHCLQMPIFPRSHFFHYSHPVRPVNFLCLCQVGHITNSPTPHCLGPLVRQHPPTKDLLPSTWFLPQTAASGSILVSCWISFSALLPRPAQYQVQWRD